MRTCLEESLSPARTACRLAIHRSTVVYRIKQAEELLGHGVAQRRRLELEAALRPPSGVRRSAPPDHARPADPGDRLHGVIRTIGPANATAGREQFGQLAVTRWLRPMPSHACIIRIVWRDSRGVPH